MKFASNKIVSIFLVIFSSGVFATEGEPADKLLQALQNINTFKAHFVQKIHDANGEHYAKSEGEIMVRRPGKFYWKSQAPDPILVVGDGKHLWTYDIDLSQVTKQTQNEALGNTPAALLAGSLSTLKENFKITQAKKTQCVKSEECYLLHPMQKDAAFADILIGFAKGKITEIKMHDSLGQNVYTLFTKVEINQTLNDSHFAFSPPKGVDIIHSGS
ncbi:MAG: outer membrane lipoprotein chaperone LolA [Proteobacteria bacterium]|nr:outer membrane lipoprotein chaperone LolA [Pseudomonadota bacterium]